MARKLLITPFELFGYQLFDPNAPIRCLECERYLFPQSFRIISVRCSSCGGHAAIECTYADCGAIYEFVNPFDAGTIEDLLDYSYIDYMNSRTL